MRGAPTDALLTHLAPTLVPCTHPATTALLPFKEPLVQAAVRELKYYGNADAEAMLAAILAEYALALSEDTYRAITVVPLPLSPARLRERGFNQCERVAERSGLPLDTDSIHRIRNTEHQARLSKREREANVRGAFAPLRAVQGSHTYIILDDVITTGATMQAAIDALEKAGARYIMPVSLSH